MSGNKRRLGAYILVLLALWLVGCGGKKQATNHVEELFSAMFNVTQEDLENYPVTELGDLGPIFAERFAPHITESYYDKFLANRQSKFFVDRLTDRYTSEDENISTVVLTIDAVEGKEQAYDVKGEGSYFDAAGEGHPYAFTAYVETMEENGEELVNYIRLNMEEE